MLAIWYMRKQRIFFVPFLMFSIVALAAVPVEGGHHVVDIFGGAAFAGVGIIAARRLVDWLTNLDQVRRLMLAEPAIDVV